MFYGFGVNDDKANSVVARKPTPEQIFDRRAELDETDPRLFDALLLKIA